MTQIVMVVKFTSLGTHVTQLHNILPAITKSWDSRPACHRNRVPDPTGMPLARSRLAAWNACKINKYNRFRFASCALPTPSQTQSFSYPIFNNLCIHKELYIMCKSTNRCNDQPCEISQISACTNLLHECTQLNLTICRFYIETCSTFALFSF